MSEWVHVVRSGYDYPMVYRSLDNALEYLYGVAGWCEGHFDCESSYAYGFNDEVRTEYGFGPVALECQTEVHLRWRHPVHGSVFIDSVGMR